MKPSNTSNLGSKRDRSGRRSFFVRLLVAIGGGLAAGSLLQRIVGSSATFSANEHSVSLTKHPLAVPRAKEGSQPHV